MGIGTSAVPRGDCTPPTLSGLGISRDNKKGESELMLTPNKDPRFQWEESLNVVRWLKGTDEREEERKPFELVKPTKEDEKYLEVAKELLKISYEKNIKFFNVTGMHPKMVASWVKSGFIPRDRWRQIEHTKIVDGIAYLTNSKGVMGTKGSVGAVKDDTPALPVEGENPLILTLERRIKLHSLRTVARELGVSHTTVSSWIKKGTIPNKYFKDGELVGNDFTARREICIG
jgi:hypothetical protein